MRLLFMLSCLVAAIVAEHDHAWKTGNEYQFLVRSRTLTGLERPSEQFAGILMKGILTVQVKSPDTLQAMVSKPQYARVHKTLPNGWDSRISDQILDMRELPLSGKSFEIRVKHGVIRDILVDKDVPTWEVNVLKSIVSQLQIDTQGENAMRSKSTQVPDDEQPFAMFKAMEDSVGGKCEVLYDITPLPEHVLHNKPELVPMPDLREDGMHIDIMKTKNYSRCEQRMGYHFGISGETNWEPGSNDNGRFLSKSTTSRVIISGNLKRFTIQSSVTTNKIFVSPRIHDYSSGTVYSKMNLTLARISKMSAPMSPPENPVSIGNLVYTYNNPFSELDERKPGRPSISRDSLMHSKSASSVSSSEEKRHDSDQTRSSKSSSASSSSISSSEEREFWQSKPRLEEPPESPLLPYFVGFMGKNIQKSEKIDVVRMAKDIITQMSEELEKPNDLMPHETLEKFTILTRLIRIMNTKQIAEVESMMSFSSNRIKNGGKDGIRERNAWDMLRDAVVQAGTGPALMTMMHWMEDRKLEGIEAAVVLLRLPQTARTPTAEYVKVVFDMLSKPELMQQRFLNESIPLAFAELLRKSQVSNTTLHNHYPVHSFGRMTSKHDRELLQTYIPFMSSQLRKAIKDGDSPRIQTYIVALGLIGHPKILSVFEPYLEGTVPVSNFQRLTMVTSLAKLAETSPRICRSVLYKIYLNVMEIHEVRCAAVYLLMKTNPPLSMLQRMAEFTNYDYNRHVNSAVKTTIESIAKLKRPEYQDLINKARIAKNLLNPRNYGMGYSQGRIMDSVIGKREFGFMSILNTIGSHDSDIPKALYIAVSHSYGGFKPPTTEVGYAVSSIKQLFGMLEQPENEEQMQKWSGEMIARTLGIQPEDPEQLEGHIFLNTMHGAEFYAFDNHTIEEMKRMMKKYLVPLKEGQHINWNTINNYEVTLGFPTETGFPFVYTLKSPKLQKMTGKTQLEMDRTEGLAIKAKAELRAVLASKVQGRIGFVTPFEHRHYMAGIDTNIQLYLPAKWEVKMEPAKTSMELKMRLMNDEPEIKMMHYSVVPYTAVRDILDLRPVLVSKDTHLVREKEPRQRKISMGSGMVVIMAEGDDLDEMLERGSWKEEDTSKFMETYYKPWINNESRYRKFEMDVNPDVGENDWIGMSIAYDNMDVNADMNEQSWPMKVSVPTMTDKEVNSEIRRKAFLKEVSKGINSATSHVLDIGIDLPSKTKRMQEVFTVAVADSNVDEKSRFLFYWNIQSPEREVRFETCAAGQMRSSRNILLDFDKAIKSEPKIEFNGEIQFGISCANGETIKLKGKQTQTDDLKEAILNSETARRCRHEMKEGNKGLRACEKASRLAETQDLVDLTMEVESPALNMGINRVIQVISDDVVPDTSVEVVSPRNAGKNTIDMKMKMSPDFKKADISLYTSEMDVTFPTLDLKQMSDESSFNENEIDTLLENKDEVSCTLDKNRAVTFDDKTYPLTIGQCWHVMMTTYPQANADKPEEFLPVPEDMRVTVMVREMEDDSKQVRLMLRNKEIHLMQSGDKLQATVDGQKVKFSQRKSYEDKEDDEVVFEIFELPDGTIRVMSERHDLNAVYDGQRVRLEISDEYRSAVRGLCGNYDAQPDNDFTTPKNCVLKRPEEFCATFALTRDDCKGPAMENLQKAEKSTCVRSSIRQSNVISDKEAGRVSTESKKWGYHRNRGGQEKRCNSYRTKVEEIGNEICFTTRPVPACIEGCKPVEMKMKKYMLHCMTKNDASLQLKSRIEEGANPDMSQQPVTMSKTIEVPIICAAA